MPIILRFGLGWKNPAITLSCLCLIIGTWTAKQTSAQVMVWEAGQKELPKLKAAPAEPAADAPTPSADVTKQVRLITLSPMGEPKPPLRYSFWKSPGQRKPGSVNAAVSKAMLLYLSHPKRAELDEQYQTSAERWCELRVTDDALRQHVAAQREILETIYEASELDTIQLNSAVRNRRGQPTWQGTFPEIQALRSLVRVVQLDGRLAISENRFEDAIRSIQAGFRLAEYAKTSGDANILSALVSIALTGTTFGMVEELSEQPTAPNLYWALTTLPTSLWDLRDSLEGESITIAQNLGLSPFMEMADPPVTTPVAEQALVDAVRFFMSEVDPNDGADANAPDQRLKEKLVAGAVVLAFSHRAASDLKSWDFTAEQISAMSPAETVVRQTRLAMSQQRDDLFKWYLLGSMGQPLAEQQWQAWRQQLQTGETLNPASIVIGSILPALEAANSAALRIEVEHKQLLLREAIRAYAAVNQGAVPETLTDLRPLPAWPNPNAGQMFEYEKTGDNEAVVRREPFHQADDRSEIRLHIQSGKTK